MVRSVNLGLATGLIGGGMLVPLGSIFARDILGAGAAGYGIFITALGFGVAVGVLLLSVLQKTACPKVGSSSWRSSAPAARSSSRRRCRRSRSPSSVVFVLGICGGAVYVVGFTLLHENVDDELRGRIFSALYTIVRLCLLIAFALGPFLSELLDRISNRLLHQPHDHHPRARPLRARRTPHAVVRGRHHPRRRHDRGVVAAGGHAREAGRLMLIAFEGGEGSGKSTQAGILAERLGAVLTHEPGATRLGARLRELVLDPNADIDPRAEALVARGRSRAAPRRGDRSRAGQGRDVVTDRYLYSSLAYQAFGRGLELQSVRALSAFAGAPEADLVVLITVSPETRAQRLKATPDRIEASGDDFHQRVELGFKAMADADPQRWAVIDGDGTVDDASAPLYGRRSGSALGGWGGGCGGSTPCSWTRR